MPNDSLNTPLLSIIIVTKNDYDNLIITFNSFSYSDDIRKNIQLILVDGGSTDTTPSFIQTHSSDFDKIISEPDKGIYDAMNKGIKYANAEWCIFMNAGDTFANSDVVTRIFEYLTPEVDVLFGDCILKYPGFNVQKKAGNQRDMWRGMITTHQSFVIKTELQKENPFDLTYKFGADFDQIFKLYKQGKRFKYLPIPIAVIDTSGVSNTKIIKARKEHYKSLRKNERPPFRMHFYYLFNFVFLTAINIVRLVLPKKTYNSLIKESNRSNLV